jgi:L-alanine-DL-glutamate epimerase-like enolase superfamily enzyme
MAHLNWTIEAIHLPLKYTWKLSRNATDEKTNLIVSCSDGKHTGKGEAAPNIRYGESPELLLDQFHALNASLNESFHTLEELEELFDRQHTAYALRFAVESAWLHFKHKGNGVSLLKELNVPFRNHVPVAYTIPIMDPGELKSFYSVQGLERFPLIKLKINRELADELTKQTISICKQPVLLDANEAFTDVEDCIHFLERCRKYPIELVEQPLPSALKEEAEYMKRYCPFPLFADESITHDPDMEHIKKAYDGINMKLMKAGGYLPGLRILSAAKAAGMRTMIGCMVETTLGISSALRLSSLVDYADLDSFLLLQNEPYGLLKESEGILSYTNTAAIH